MGNDATQRPAPSTSFSRTPRRYSTFRSSIETVTSRQTPSTPPS